MATSIIEIDPSDYDLVNIKECDDKELINELESRGYVIRDKKEKEPKNETPVEAVRDLLDSPLAARDTICYLLGLTRFATTEQIIEEIKTKLKH